MIKNIIANFFGKFWSLFSNFIFIPIYIKFLGFENYAVISFGLIISGIMAVLDSGLTATLSREMARADNSANDKERIFKTLESLYFIITTVVIFLVFFSSNIIASSWVDTKLYSMNELSLYVSIIGIDAGFQLLIRFYLGGLIGMEQQVLSNLFQISWGAIRSGFVLIALFIVPTLKMFFIWQAASSVLFGFILCFKLRKVISGVFFTGFPNIEKHVLSNSWKFARGMLLISLVAALNTQMDKLAISKLLPVEQLGYYTLAISISMGLMFVVSPFSTAILPRMTKYFTSNLINEAQILFNRIQNLVSILIMSISAILFFYSNEIIWIWTGEIFLSNQSHTFLKILCIGVSFLALQIVPFNVAMANGFTKLNNIIGLLSLFISIPGYWFFTLIYGGLGAAVVYSGVQVLTTLFYLYFINKKFFSMTSFMRIFIKPMFIPLITTFTFAYGFSLIPYYMKLDRLSMFLWICLVTIFVILLTLIFLLPKSDLIMYWRKIYKHKNKYTRPA